MAGSVRGHVGGALIMRDQQSSALVGASPVPQTQFTFHRGLSQPLSDLDIMTVTYSTQNDRTESNMLYLIPRNIQINTYNCSYGYS